MDVAFGFHEQIGRDRVVARTVEQATRIKEELAGVRGIARHHPRLPRRLRRDRLHRRRRRCPARGRARPARAGVVASATPYRTSYLRLGPSIVTSDDDVSAAIEAVAALV